MEHSHYHPNDVTKVVDGKTYIGVRESRNLMVSPDGTFLTGKNQSGMYRGNEHDDAGHYLRVHVGKRIPYAHRVVYEVCTNTEIPDDKEIDHINNNSQDNRLENLRVVSRLENMRNPLTVVKQRAWLNAAHNDPEFEHKRKTRQLEFAKSPEHASRLKMYGERKSKPVICRNIKTGETIRFDHQYEAVRTLGLVSGSITSCCSGKLKTTGDWQCYRPQPDT